MSGSISTPTFTNLVDGTVAQDGTGLIWAKCAEGLSGADCSIGTASGFTWQQALQAAQTANEKNLGGHNDWRLPNVKELQSLVNYSKLNPAINSTYFPNTPSTWFWASSPYAYDSGYAWSVYFYFGYVLYHFKDDTGQVRLVRSGQSSWLLAVTKTGDGTGTVTSSPAGINCGITCNANFAQDQLVKLTATADSGSIFSGWQDCPNMIFQNENSCNVTIDAAETVTAIFTSGDGTIPIGGGGGGGIIPAPIDGGGTTPAPIIP